MKTRAGVVLMFGYASVWYASALFLHSRAASLLSLRCLNASLCCLEKSVWARGWNPREYATRYDSINSTRCRAAASHEIVEMVRKMKTRRLLYLFAAGERSKYIRIYTKRASSPRAINMRCTCECRGKERQLKRIFTRFVWHLIQTGTCKRWLYGKQERPEIAFKCLHQHVGRVHKRPFP